MLLSPAGAGCSADWPNTDAGTDAEEPPNTKPGEAVPAGVRGSAVTEVVKQTGETAPRAGAAAAGGGAAEAVEGNGLGAPAAVPAGSLGLDGLPAGVPTGALNVPNGECDKAVAALCGWACVLAGETEGVGVAKGKDTGLGLIPKEGKVEV